MVETEERISDCEERTIEMTYSELQREIDWGENESLRDMWDYKKI